mgnify:CR=1 FL=1
MHEASNEANVKKKMDFYQIISNKAAQEDNSGAASLLTRTGECGVRADGVPQHQK